MRFTAMIDGYECYLDIGYGTPAFRCAEISKEFDTLEKLQAAITAHDLSLRKNFSNKTAYRLGDQWGNDRKTSKAVEVTSVTADGRYALIKTAKGRAKVPLSSLYADADEVASALSVESECERVISDAWAKVAKWGPKP